MKKSDIMLAFAREQVSKPYKLGARGPDAWDCSGLVKGAAKMIGYDLYHGATTQWNRGHQRGDPAQYGYWADSGTIDTLPRDKMAVLFNQDKNYTDKLVMAHTGLYDGAGRVVQAGGYGGRGVHDNPLDARRWSHWAILKGADDDMIGLAIGMTGTAVRDMQRTLIGLGYDLGKWGADGKFGAATEKGVMAFQADNGLTPDGVWKSEDQARADTLISTPAAPGAPQPIDTKALLAELATLTTRLSAIVRALQGG